MTMTIGNCKDCLYFRQTHESIPERPFSIGLCQRFPPVVVIVRGAEPLPAAEAADRAMEPAQGYKWESVFPTVMGEIGCGEFKAREGDH